MNTKQKNIYGTPTPRTDASEANASARLFDTGANQRERYCLRLDMEQLERELAEAKAENAELRKDKLFTVCPKCGGSGEFNNVCEAYACPKCDGTGYVPWTPKAAPLVWEGNADDDNPKAFLSKNPDVFFICYETMGVGYRALLKCGVEIVWDECGFGTMDKARAACQSCADALAYKLVTGKEPQ